MINDNKVLAPQAGPQQTFVNLWSGMAGVPDRGCDFPLVFYGGEVAPRFYL